MVGESQTMKIIENNVLLLELEDVKNALGERPRDSHKGTFGYVGILSGSLRYSGAAKLANLGAAAMRSGCGVVTLGVPASLAPAVAPYLLESTLFPMPDAEGSMLYDPLELDSFLSGKRAVAVGMGWGRSNEYSKILEHLFQHFSGTILLDADALNTIAEQGLDLLKEAKGTAILTPHPGEFARLSGKTIEEIAQNPVAIAKEFATAHHVVVLLKGATTIVTDGSTVYCSDRGCAGMATAGSGDVLSGILVGLLGYLPPSALSVACGAFIAGLAGEIAQEKTNAFSMVASDTVSAIPVAISKIIQ